MTNSRVHLGEWKAGSNRCPVVVLDLPFVNPWLPLSQNAPLAWRWVRDSLGGSFRTPSVRSEGPDAAKRPHHRGAAPLRSPRRTRVAVLKEP